MKKSVIFKFFVLTGIVLCTANFFTAIAATPGAEGVEYFEKKVRPLLIDNCYKCHSQESAKVKGGLLLDSKESVLKGGDSGPAIVPGDPDKSLLIKAVRYFDEKLQMPPKDKKLSSEQITDLEVWVKMGAPDPRTQGAKSNVQSSKSPQAHWAFQPIHNSPVPKVKDKRWAQTPIDGFILAKLEGKKIKPSAPADKRTLIRRATFDLLGLPPSAQDVEQFVTDKSPDAFAKVVDRLLASPAYGERWGRHWLDVARYADTKGYLAGNEERRFAYSYTYRDFVIRAFNEDLPYDKFLTQQIAADRLELGDDKRPLAALGFLTLGRRFLNNQQDIIDDRIDVITRGTMGLTVACARCHDHKYDPIPTKDYYSLYGIFASSHEPEEKPLLGTPPPENLHAEYLAEKKKREETAKNFREQKSAEVISQLRVKSGEYMLAALDSDRLADKSKSEALARERKLDPGVVQRWVKSLAGWSNATNPIFAPWFAFTSVAEKDFATNATQLAQKFATDKSLNPLVAESFKKTPSSLKEVVERYDKIFAAVEKSWRDALAAQVQVTNAATLKVFIDPNQEALRQILYAPDAPPNLSEVEGLFDIPSIERLRELRRQVAEIDATHAGAPARAMALADNGTPQNSRVFIRGNAGNPGVEAPRQFLEVIAGENRKPFEKGSGRLELAQAIANKSNPLTARVIVNRVWLNHFGKGLVTTPSDFGVRSDPPSHPELLDYLAWNFMENGWSLKKLHRQIMLSSVYQQRSEEILRSSKVDPENRLLWKMNRQRLDFEELRDSLLVISGKLESTSGGRSIDIFAEPFSGRRTVYGYIDRQNLPGVFRTFDFANPDASSAQRFFTTVPQQALFFMNNPFVIEQAKRLTTNEQFATLPSNEKRIRFLHEKIYQRTPASEEVRLAERFLQSQPDLLTNSISQLVWRYGYGQYDEKKKQVIFSAFPHFEKKQWRISAQYPDPEFGYVMLDSTGGHPGNRVGEAAIRRWIAPVSGPIKIEGELRHSSEGGDGILGRIVSNRQGELGKWIVHNATNKTIIERCEVRAGEIIDFIADMQADSSHDTFRWSPVIKLSQAASDSVQPTKTEWGAQGEFDGPQNEFKSIGTWEKYTQVLLLSNEFMFVD
ncbi:MAG: PSD1 and planctomycete cytochrome C domain-containing protein [Verrucomicrobiota bacterium]